MSPVICSSLRKTAYTSLILCNGRLVHSYFYVLVWIGQEKYDGQGPTLRYHCNVQDIVLFARRLWALLSKWARADWLTGGEQLYSWWIHSFPDIQKGSFMYSRPAGSRNWSSSHNFHFSTGWRRKLNDKGTNSLCQLLHCRRDGLSQFKGLLGSMSSSSVVLTLKKQSSSLI